MCFLRELSKQFPDDVVLLDSGNFPVRTGIAGAAATGRLKNQAGSRAPRRGHPGLYEGRQDVPRRTPGWSSFAASYPCAHSFRTANCSLYLSKALRKAMSPWVFRALRYSWAW